MLIRGTLTSDMSMSDMRHCGAFASTTRSEKAVDVTEKRGLPGVSANAPVAGSKKPESQSTPWLSSRSSLAFSWRIWSKECTWSGGVCCKRTRDRGVVDTVAEQEAAVPEQESAQRGAQ
jgi:hypothetical protein